MGLAAKGALVSTIVMFMTTSAMSWSASVEGPDVFGVTKALGGTSSGRYSLVIQCDTDDKLYLAIITPKKEFDDIDTVAATFHAQIDSDSPVILDASLRNWNDNYAGIVVSGVKDDLVRLIHSFGTAKRSVNVGYEVMGNRSSASFSARGSTQAIKRITNACKLMAP